MGTMTSVTPNVGISNNRKLSSSSLPSTPAISITGISTSSPMNVSLEAVNCSNASNLYSPSGLQGSATITLPSAPAPMSFNSRSASYQHQPHQQQQVQQQKQQHLSINAGNKPIIQTNSPNNLSIGGGSNIRQIQMHTVPQQQQQTQNNMTAMYNTSTVNQQFATYGGQQQQQMISPQHVASQQQGETLITVSTA